MKYLELFESHRPGPSPEQAEAILSSRGANYGIAIPPSAKLYRGTNETSGNNAASFGSGLYMTCDLKVAKEFAGDEGTVHTLARNYLPENPIRFKSRQDFELWFQNAVYKILGYRNRIDFGADYPDFRDFIQALDPSIDGFQIYTGKDAEIVNYNGPRIT